MYRFKKTIHFYTIRYSNLAKKNKDKKGSFRQKLIYNYRLVVMNDESLEELLSFKLNRLNVFVIGGLSAIALIVLTSVLIAFTPIKEYIPGYSPTKLKKTASKLVYKVDSLEQKLLINEAYIKSIKSLLTGDIKKEKINKNPTIKQLSTKDVELNASATDSAFRQDVEQKDRFSIFERATKEKEMVFFAPAKGEISGNFNTKNKHLAVDIVLVNGTPIKAVADGTVIFSGFTAKTGYVLIIEHDQGFISVYKHNETLFKEQGDLVKSGEVIANSGSTGTLTTGPHLHFELWSNGYPVNPTDYIDFK